MSHTARFQDTLRRLVIFDEGFVEDHQPAQGVLESRRVAHTPPMPRDISTPHGGETGIPRWG